MWTKIRDNVRLMLERRGYGAFKEAAVTGSKEVTYLRPCLYAATTGETIKVLFIDSVGNAECRETVRDMKAEKIGHIMYVANNIPGRFHQDMDQLSAQQSRYGLRFELFEASFFLFDKMHCEIIQRCRPEPLTLEQSKQWLAEHHLQPEQLLQYVPRDFVVRYFGLLPGQIVRVHTSPMPKYRIFLLNSHAHSCPATA